MFVPRISTGMDYIFIPPWREPTYYRSSKAPIRSRLGGIKSLQGQENDFPSFPRYSLHTSIISNNWEEGSTDFSRILMMYCYIMSQWFCQDDLVFVIEPTVVPRINTVLWVFPIPLTWRADSDNDNHFRFPSWIQSRNHTASRNSRLWT